MRTLALSPRYWARYLTLLRHPLARLVDLLVVKQGERIAHQKGWKTRGATARSAAGCGGASRGPRRPPARPGAARPAPRSRSAPEQPSLFDV